MSDRDIRILGITYLRGPNLWTYHQALEALVDIGALEDCPSNSLPGLYERLTQWLPGLIEHRCSPGVRGGFLQRLREGTWAAHILEHVALELQGLAGQRFGFGRAREAGARGLYKVVIRMSDEVLTRACLFTARDLLMAAIEDQAFDLKTTLAELQTLADARCLGPGTSAIVAAAMERKIPVLRLNSGNLVQLGHGIHQRRIWTTETDRTSAIGESISRDKDLTKRLLKACGLPVPEGELVADAEAAWAVAQEIGLPVVVKPSDANHARGVSLELTQEADIKAAFAVAAGEGTEVIVERYIPGDEHRLLIVGGRLVAANRGESLWLVGDGQSKVSELIETQINSDPRRGEAEELPLETLRLEKDAAARLLLSRQGLDGDSVPFAGQRVLIERSGNMLHEITDLVHPSFAEAAELAARVLGLDIAGIDLLAQDISRPLQGQEAAIVEVNAGPGLLMHLKPVTGQPRPVGQAIVEHLFPPGETGRIPIIGISGTSGTGLLAQLLRHLLQLKGTALGMACSDGLHFGARQVQKGPCRDWASARRLLLNNGVEIAIFENDGEDLQRQGLVYDRCQIGVLTRIDPETRLLGMEVPDADYLHRLFRTQVDVVLPSGVAILNAEDALVAGMASLCDGEVIFYGQSPESEPLADHLTKGGRAVVAQGEEVLLMTGASVTARIALNPGSAALELDALLAMLAVAWALGESPSLMQTALVTFELEASPQFPR